MMNKKQDSDSAAPVMFFRRFLVSGLPEEVSKSGPHIQVFDNYIDDTDLRLRKTRNPEDDERRYFVEKPGVAFKRPLIGIELGKQEYDAFDSFRGRETRFNRYEVEIERARGTIDVFLGDLWGVNILTMPFESATSAAASALPKEALFEITGDPMFAGNKLVDLTFEKIKEYLEQKKRRP